MTQIFTLIQFIDSDENKLADPMQVPHNISITHIKKLMPHLDTFYIFGHQITSNLDDTLKILKFNIENVVPIKAIKEGLTSAPALFCNASFSGHEQPVLSLKLANTVEEFACRFYNDSVEVNKNKKLILVSGGGDATVRFWDCLTKTQKKIQKVNQHWIQSLDIYRDLVICGSMDGNASLFTINGDFIKHFFGQEKGITNVKFGFNSKKNVEESKEIECITIDNLLKSKYSEVTIFSSGRDGRVIEWNLNGKIIFSYKHTSCCDDFVTNGDLLVSGDRTGKIIIYKNRKFVDELNAHTKRINSIDVKGKYIISGSDDFKIKVFICRENKWMPYKELAHKNIVTSVKISGDLLYFATASFDRTVRLWDLQTGNMIGQHFHNGEVYKMLFVNNLIISCGKDKAVKSFCVKKKKVVSEVKCEDEVFDIDYCEGIMVAGCKDRKVYFFA